MRSLTKIQGCKFDSYKKYKYRYEVNSFSMGIRTTFNTNSFFVAWFVCKWKAFHSICEMRIIDKLTATHYVY